MSSRMKTIGVWTARLVGVAFGLALALFLFTAVAWGHSYHSAAPTHVARSSHVQVFRIARDGGRFFRDDGFRFHRERVRFERVNVFVNVRVNVFVNVRKFGFARCGCV